MKFDLPPMMSLCAFEASARKLSFTKASHELHLTQAAVSFQVRKLEDRLGVQLFVRKNRTLLLTPEGLSLLTAVQNALSTLEAGKMSIVGRGADRRVTISVPFSLSGKWIIPRLHKLTRIDPEIDLRVDATDHLVDFNKEPIDLAIRYCEHASDNLHSTLLFSDTVFPVCSPGLMEKIGGHLGPAQVVKQTLLHDQMTDYTWHDWIKSTGLNDVLAVGGHKFSHTGNALDAAIAGQGIALGRLALVASDLEMGRLVMPFTMVGTTSYSYYIVVPKKTQSNPLVRTVIDWLISEARITEQKLL